MSKNCTKETQDKCNECEQECSHDCDNCSQNCDSKSFIAPSNASSNIKKVIGIISGKGGVGKSLVTGLLACKMAQRGHKTAILDADITGPCIPQAFGLEDAKATGEEGAINPQVSKGGIEVCSMNFFIADSSDPVIWRGPVIAGAVKQFWTDVVWGDIDYMFVDMPPGTGDVPLTVFQSLPVDAVIIVTSPQGLVSSIVEKAVKMAKTMNIAILGLIENLSYVKCPKCNEKIYIYGKGHTDKIAKQYGIPLLAQIPIEKGINTAVDTGKIEALDIDYMNAAADLIEKL